MTTTGRGRRVSPRSSAGELRTVIEPFRLVVKSPSLVRRAPRRSQVIVLPGLGGNDLSTAPLRWYLSRIGHDVQGWTLGVHRFDVAATLRRFTDRLRIAADDAGGPISLVGWSLGGVIAREAARDRPDLVAQVITFGSPIGALPPTTSRGVRDHSGRLGAERVGGFGRQRTIRVPVTTIYSRNDGVVDWRHAVDDQTPGAVNVEVASSHLGLGLDPDVWRIVADALDAHGDSNAPEDP